MNTSKSKIKLSKIVAGTMNWGVWNKKLSTQEMESLIHVCIENNIHSFDHADIYGGYTTEAEFGKAFSASSISREKVEFISKCGIKAIADNQETKVKHYDYSKKHLIWSVENSLKNLKTDYLDVLLLHRPSPLLEINEVTQAINQLIKEGKIRSFGLSNFSNAQTELIQTELPVSYNQIQFSATHLEPMVDGSLDFMQKHQITPMSWNPLGSVFREDSEKTRRLKKLLATLVEKYELGSDTILLSWVMKHPSNAIPVAGTVNVQRIKQLQKAIELELNLEDWFAIWSESIGRKVD
jgi:predicted oxidoreductase